MSGADSPIFWIGTTLDDVRELPEDARYAIGHQLRRVQRGMDPDDWKPMKTVGSGCREIRIRADDGAHRSVYVVLGSPSGVYVLAVFTKKTQRTPLSIIRSATKRYAAAVTHAKGRAR